MLLHQFKTWIYWKSKIRILQMWSNFKLFNIDNPYIIPILSMVGPFIGIFISFILGFGIAYLFQYFISNNPYHLWQIIFFVSMIEAVDRGLQNGRWISSTDEEKWLLASTPFTTTKYLLFLWVDEEIWENKNTFLSSLASLLGVYIIFQVNIIHLFIALILLNVLTVCIALIFTLFQYYIIRKSVYLKGRGLITNVLLPGASLFILLYALKYVVPWVLTYPNQMSLSVQLAWLKTIIHPIWSFVQQFIGVFNYDLYPHSLLASYVMSGDVTAIIFYSFYIFLMIMICLVLFQFTARKDHITIIKQTFFDRLMLSFFMTINQFLLSIGKVALHRLHIKYLLSTVLQNYLTKRSLFAVLGERLWIYAIFFLGVVFYAPDQYKEKIVLIIPFFIAVLYPTYFLWSIYRKFKIKLSFESEGTFLQTLIAYGASPQYMYALKTRIVQILAFPGYFLVLLFTLLLLPLPWYLIVIATLLSLLVFLVISSFVLLPSFVLPHYEFFNKQQIGVYPDQQKITGYIRSLMGLLITPTIPILMYVMNVIQFPTFLFVSSLWIFVGSWVLYELLDRIYWIRLTNFDIEEISLNRAKQIDNQFWKRKGPLFIIILLIYVGTSLLTLTGDFLFAGILYIVPMAIIQVTFISSFRKKLADQ